MQVITRNGDIIQFNQTTNWVSGGTYTEVVYNDRNIGTIVDGNVDVEDAFQLEVEEAFRLQ